MAEPLECPHCAKLLTDSQVSTLYGRMTNARRKTKSGGKNGGRRPLPRPEMPNARLLDELDGLRESHARAVERGDKSSMVRKGWQSSVDGHMLTDEELAYVTGLPNPPTSPDSAEDAKGYTEHVLVPLEDL